MHRLIALVLAAAAALPASTHGQSLQSIAAEGTVKFAVIGDFGSGERPQYEIGERMAAERERFPFEFVITVGDNLYGGQSPQDFVVKFERPFAALLGAKVPFYAALGNHDQQSNRSYQPFNMGGNRYYTYAKKRVRFVVLDTNLLDAPQLSWAEGVLRDAVEPWKVAVFHHPLYSNAGRHGSNVPLRVILEPLLTRHGVSVVFAGHEHVYERIKPQKGITYFTEGSSGQLRKGDMQPSSTTAASYDQDRTFMLVDITGDEMTFRTVSRTGTVVDSGVVRRRPSTQNGAQP
jgi:3',5'-cyclic AMP phosphodiesterase CpdA